MQEYKSFGKLNIFLDVIKIYKNNYHGLKSVFVETSLHDIIEYEKNNSNRINVIDRSGILPEDNLLTKAAKIFIEASGKLHFGMDFYITKKIPIGGGMGGGSSNAAGVIKILNKMWNINYSNKRLEIIAEKIGADVPYFIGGGTQLIYGTGSILRKLNNTPKLNLLIVIPKVFVSTPFAYKLIDENNLCKNQYNNQKKFKSLLTGLNTNNINLIVNNLYNKFEEVVFPVYPVLQEIKKEILKTGAINSIMSGSGSTMIGVYNNCFDLENANKNLLAKNYETYIVNLK